MRVLEGGRVEMDFPDAEIRTALGRMLPGETVREPRPVDLKGLFGDPEIRCYVFAHAITDAINDGVLRQQGLTFVRIETPDRFNTRLEAENISKEIERLYHRRSVLRAMLKLTEKP